MSPTATDRSIGVESTILTLKTIDEKGFQFKVPGYQRPYVWSAEDVLKLFDDIKEACRSGEKHYFIGTVLSSLIECDNGELIYELVDGQQRTTTLMLICIAFLHVGVNSRVCDLAVYRTGDKGEDNGQPRLQFAIRDQVEQLLGAKSGLDGYVVPSLESIASNPYLKQIDTALHVLTQAVENLPDSGVSASMLGEFLYHNVQWVHNVVPARMDLNRLFATMNMAGIQLQQSDILKARLLKHITTDKATFEAMWAACEQMDNYFERNVRNVFAETDWSQVRPEDVADSANFRSTEKDEVSATRRGGLTIAELERESTGVKPAMLAGGSVTGADEPDEKTVYCRSIIPFPLLLIHAYRIWLATENSPVFDISPRLHSDRLLEIFAPLCESSEYEITGFFRTLWQVRYLFDRWVVKWVERDDESGEAQLGLANQSQGNSKNNYYISRTRKEQSAIVLLQSLRNFTGERSAQYWLTPFLAGLLELQVNMQDEPAALRLLEDIDNKLSLCTDTQKEASFALASGQNPAAISWTDKSGYFAKTLGTSFDHYWFQKLEYLLWKQLNKPGSDLRMEETDKFSSFRITSKNSVEHVHPQNEEHGNRLAGDLLNSFGNLVLLSPGENSAYSNQTVLKKCADFQEKPRFDSLKLREIFSLYLQNKRWGEREIAEHQRLMLEVLESHYIPIRQN